MSVTDAINEEYKALTLANNYYNCGHHSIHLAKTRKMRYILRGGGKGKYNVIGR